MILVNVSAKNILRAKKIIIGVLAYELACIVGIQKVLLMIQ